MGAPLLRKTNRNIRYYLLKINSVKIHGLQLQARLVEGQVRRLIELQIDSTVTCSKLHRFARFIKLNHTFYYKQI